MGGEFEGRGAGIVRRAADYGKHASSGIEVDRSTLGTLISNEVRYTAVPGRYGGLRITKSTLQRDGS